MQFTEASFTEAIKVLQEAEILFGEEISVKEANRADTVTGFDKEAHTLVMVKS